MTIKKILIVDDSPTERHYLSEILVKGGFDVVTSDSGEDALIKAKTLQPDLILMDVVMPGMNGFQATRAITRDEATKLRRTLTQYLEGSRRDRPLRARGQPRARATRPTFASASLPHLVSVRVCEPADGVAEVSVAFRRAERVRALAFRIQGVDGRWRMTALQLC